MPVRLWLLLVTSTLGGCVPPGPPVQLPPPGVAICDDFTGVWDTTYGAMIVTARGDLVTGVYPKGRGKLTARLEGQTLHGNFADVTGRGPLRLVLAPDGRILSMRPSVLDDGLGGRVVGWEDGDLAAAELQTWEPARPALSRAANRLFVLADP